MSKNKKFIRKWLTLTSFIIGAIFLFHDILGSSILDDLTADVSEGEKEEMEGSYLVSRVVDGDTYVLNIDGVEEKVRLIGVNTPETVDPRKEVECYGEEASNFAKETLEGRQVKIETDSTQGERDKYDRLLVYIIQMDGTNFNEYLIQEGYAYEYTYDKAYKYQEQFKTAQQTAEENQKGLWGAGCQ